MRRPFLWLAMTIAAAAACQDKVHSDEVDALGPETDGIPEGPRHRAGQNCTTCHGPVLGTSPEISVGGTVYMTPTSKVPAVGAQVFVTDANGNTHEPFTTNDVGNFHARKDAYDPPFPLQIKVTFVDANGQMHKQEMQTLIRRDGGCGRCHDATDKNGDSSHVGRIFAISDAPTPAQDGGP